jgi:hypothetical protein
VGRISRTGAVSAAVSAAGDQGRGGRNLNRKYDDLYCKLFIDADVGKEELEKLLISYLNGSRKDILMVKAEGNG